MVNLAILVSVIPLDQDELVVRQCASLLDPTERARADRFVTPRLRRRFVVSHGVMRQILASHLGLPARDLMFIRRPGRKPAILRSPGEPTVTCSLSRSEDLALLAIGSAGPLGVDVEALRADPRLEAGWRRHLEPWLPTGDSSASALRCWTQAEALGKADGRGIEAGLARWRAWHAGENLPNWHLVSFAPRPGFVATVAAGAPPMIALREWKPPRC
jgi:4'-phosphopantetheinyl transferase